MHYVFYGVGGTFISLVQWLALSGMFRLYSFKLKKIGEKGSDSDHGLAQEFYLPEGTEENNEKLIQHDHWPLGSSLTTFGSYETD